MTGPFPRVPALLVLVWVAGVVLATSIGLLAVRLVAAQVGDPVEAPLSAVAGVRTEPAPASGTPPTGSSAPASSASSTAAPTPGAGEATSPVPGTPRALPPPSAPPAPRTAAAAPVRARTFTTAAGTLGVQCAGTGLRLLYVTPAPGSSLDERRVTGTSAEVRFERGTVQTRVRLSCATGAPRLVEQRTDSSRTGGADTDDPDDGRADEPVDERTDDPGEQERDADD